MDKLPDKPVADKSVADKPVADKPVADKSFMKKAFAKKAIAIRNVNLVLPHANEEEAVCEAEQPNNATNVSRVNVVRVPWAKLIKEYAKTTTAHGFPYLIEGSKARRYVF